MTRKIHKPYRSELASTKDTLTVLEDSRGHDVKISVLCSRANMEHYSMIDKCKGMLEGLLIEEHREPSECNKSHRGYAITENGVVALRTLEKLENFLKSVGLRL